jgi:gamma-glutamyl hercynylcysteine S-oxide synthase
MSQRFAILPWFTAISCIGAIGAGEYFADERFIACGAGGLIGLAIIAASTGLHCAKAGRRRVDSGRAGNLDGTARGNSAGQAARSEPRSLTPTTPLPGDVDSLVKQMLADGRFALLLRPQIAGNVSPDLLAAAQEDLDGRMALVPDGTVQIEPNRLSAVAELDVPEEALERVTIHVAVTYLDRYPVTNRQYQAFVDAGGYEQMAIWEPAVWPAVLDFVDTTGRPGPRYWVDGRCPVGKENHPVVGVCWYEAAAFARWVGRRLPTDAEWVKAAAWPVNISTTTCVQRKYPWGNTMERQRANLWGSGAGETVPVDQFASGVSVGGVYQLIGNVWEWTTDDFLWIAALADERTNQPLLKTIRGGAFDTYFDNQATSQFASGENPLGRKHNIGFRCALGICDLAASAPEPVSESDCQLEEQTCQAV